MSDAQAAAAQVDTIVGMDFLESRTRKAVTIYLPLAIFLFVLLFPFYWMAITTFKPNEELLSREGNPFWVMNPTLAHIKKLLFDTAYPEWLWNTVIVSVVSTFASLAAAVMAAYAIERLRFNGAKQVELSIFLAYLVPPSILFIPLAAIVYQLGLFDTRSALILTYPTFLIPFCTWLLMGYFRSIPFELEECALIDGATSWQILTKIVLPLAVPGLISAGIFAFTLSWNEFIYALHVRVILRGQDGAGRRGHRTGGRRCVPRGLLDGRRPVRLAAGGLRLPVLRRVLRVGHDRLGEGVTMLVGFVGLGSMGAPMALNLVKAGHAVQAFDVRAGAANDLVAAGDHAEPSAAEAARGAGCG